MVKLLKVMPVLINMLDDQVPRVVSHAAAAITNFVENMEIEDINQYLQSILTKNFNLLKNSISIVKVLLKYFIDYLPKSYIKN